MSAATTSAAGRLTDAELKAQEKAARKAEKARQKRIAADEAAERRRSAKAGFANVNNPRRSTLLTVLCAVFAVYCLFPFVYLLINATKTGRLHQYVRPGQDVRPVRQHRDGVLLSGRDLRALAVQHDPVRGGRAGGATLLAIMGGYALAVPLPGAQSGVRGHHRRDQRAGHRVGGPQFLLFAKLGLTNTPGHDHPVADQPVRFVLMWIFSEQAVPQELLEAARVTARPSSARSGRSAPLLAPAS